MLLLVSAYLISSVSAWAIALYTDDACNENPNFNNTNYKGIGSDERQAICMPAGSPAPPDSGMTCDWVSKIRCLLSSCNTS